MGRISATDPGRRESADHLNVGLARHANGLRIQDRRPGPGPGAPRV
ncbi:MAG: hypothetical protein K6A65_00480 [Succinivibrionaceae bacterium]|nr:hypothetical protein [Succinivibrionaceae bacterium]